MKRILLSFLTIGVTIGIAFGVTQGLFSDSETSKDNKLQAGKLDLKIDNTSYLNHATSSATTWQAKDLTSGDLFFNFTDLKPGDEGEDTISIHVDNNDAWACMDMKLTKDDDNTCTEPEKIDDPTCNEPNGNLFDGELGGLLNFIFWTDNGNNVLEVGEPIIASGSAKTVLDSKIVLADSATNHVGGKVGDPLKGGQTYNIGKAWCFGTLTPNPVLAGQGISPIVNSGVLCDGSSLNNASQSDVVMADIGFTAIQSRHNPGFLCSGQPSPSPSPTPSPTPQACQQADVMLVLDRSGSIDSTELGQLKTAAKDFVDALGLSTTGIHGGQTSFATTGTLDQQLTDSGPTLKTAINALDSGGFTNLQQGINLASGELASVRDRADGSSPDKMIIITDGNPNRPVNEATARPAATTAATTAKGLGTEIFVVGVGSDVDTTYLQNQIASPGDYFSVSDYSALKTTLQNLNLCD